MVAATQRARPRAHPAHDFTRSYTFFAQWKTLHSFKTRELHHSLALGMRWKSSTVLPGNLKTSKILPLASTIPPVFSQVLQKLLVLFLPYQVQPLFSYKRIFPTQPSTASQLVRSHTPALGTENIQPQHTRARGKSPRLGKHRPHLQKQGTRMSHWLQAKAVWVAIQLT